MNDRVGRFLWSPAFEAIEEKQNRFRPGRVCALCRKPIRSTREHGGGRPGAYRPGQTYRSALRSIVRNWKHLHWVCLGKDRVEQARIFRVKVPSRWSYAVLYRGDIDGLPFRIAMRPTGSRRFSLDFGAYCTPPRIGKNLVLGFSMSGSEWARFVAKIRGVRREANSIRFGSGGWACSDPVNDYIRKAVRTAEFRRRRFFAELRKDEALQGPIL